MSNKNFQVKNGLTVGTTSVDAATGNTIIGGDLQVNGNDIKSATGATAISLNDNTTILAGDLQVNGTIVGLAQDTTIAYDENNDRRNRPTVQSNSGNSSGLRVRPPVATTSALATLSVGNTNDQDNTTFLSLQASGSTTEPMRIASGKYTAGVFGPSGKSISVRDGTTTYATLNPAGPTNPTDLTTKSYVDGLTPTLPSYTTNVAPAAGGVELDLQEIIGTGITIVGSTKFIGGTNITVSETAPNEITIDGTDLNTTYDFNATSTTGGVNLNLVGSDSTTDTVKITSGTGVTASYVSGTEVSVAIGQAVGTSDDVQFSSVRTPTINANGGVSFVDTSPMGTTYATVNQLGPFNGTDLTTVDWVNNQIGTTSPVLSVNSQTGAVVLDTDDISEGATNKYFSDTLARQSISATGNISYNSTTGVISTSLTQYTDAQARASISATGDISYNNTTGVISYTAPTAPVTSVNGQTGAVVLDTDDISEGATNKYFSDTLARAALSGGTGISYNSTTGVITSTITQYTDAQARSAVANGTDLAIDGSNNVYVKSLRDGTRLLGSLQATTDNSYVFPLPALNTISNNNGLDAVSSMPANSLGDGAAAAFTHYFGDTFAGTNTGPVFAFKTANGNSTTTGTVPFTGLTPVAPSAVTSSNVLGGLNFNGYATTGFSDVIGTQNQGGGFNAVHAGQVQMAPVETFADGTLTISGATITAVSRVSVAQTVTAIAGTKGQLTIPSTLAGVGTAVIVTGTNIGTGTGITAGTYYIVANNGGAGNSTQITLSATVGGNPIDTTPGTVTGLTFTRQLITATYSAQTNIPFGLNAKVTISGFNNVTSGTFMVLGSSTTTSVSIGAPSSGTPTLSGSQSISCPTVTAGGTTFRVRGFPAATPLNSGNRVDYINHSPATATYKSNQFNLQGGTNTFNFLTANAAAVTAQGSFLVKDLTGTTTYATVDVSKAAFTVPVGFPVKTAAQWRAITGAVGYQVCVSDSASGGNPNGMMAFWDTSNARWSYIHDNSAV